MSSVPGLNGLVEILRVLLRQPDRFAARGALHRAGEVLVILGPGRQADLFDISLQRLRQHPIVVARPRGAEDAPRHLGIRHHRRTVGDAVADAEVLAHVLHVGLADVVPDLRQCRHDVRLFAAVGDDVVRTLFRPQVLAAHVPAHVHQLDRVERAASAPWRGGGMRGRAVECVFHRDQPAGAAHLAPAGLEIGADMGEQHRIDTVEQSVTYLERLARQQFLGDAGPQHQRAGQALVLHQLLQCERRGDVHRLARVVALAVTRATFHQRLVIGHARLLRNVRQRIGVAAECYHRAA